MATLLQVRDLRTQFFTQEGVVNAVNGVSFDLEEGETLGIVGESGCGKSVSVLSMMRLIPQPPGRIVGGEVIFQGRDLLKLSEEEMRHVRGNKIAMVFQDPMTSLNPVLTIGQQLGEALELHLGMTKDQARERSIELLEMVNIPEARARIDDYPHQFSGGMRQRVMIAMALSCNPQLLIADEPTTALDVTIQAQVLDLMNELRREFKAAIQFITHNLGVIASMADDVVVMYLGRIVEGAAVGEVFHAPKHPYTQGLMHSIPSLASRKERLVPIKGVVPDPFDVPEGCGFEPRCPHAMEICRTKMPPLKDVVPNHQAACWLYP